MLRIAHKKNQIYCIAENIDYIRNSDGWESARVFAEGQSSTMGRLVIVRR